MPEAAAHQSSGNFRDNNGLFPGFFLESDYISVKRLCPGVPGHIQETEAKLAAASITGVEVGGID